MDKFIDENGIDITITENIYANNSTQFKDVLKGFLLEPWGKIFTFDYNYNDNYDSVEISIEPRGVEDGFDIRFDGEAVATGIFAVDVSLNLTQKLTQYILTELSSP